MYVINYMYCGNLVTYNYMIVFSFDTGQYRDYIVLCDSENTIMLYNDT